MRPIAESRFVSSNSSLTNWRSAPRSPRNFSSVRGSRPSPSAKLARSTSSTARAACSLTAVVCATSFSNSRRTTSTSTVVEASWRASRPIRSARSTTAGRSASGRARRATAARAASARTSRSTTIRSPSMRTVRAPVAAGGRGTGVGRGRIRASMARILAGGCDSSGGTADARTHAEPRDRRATGPRPSPRAGSGGAWPAPAPRRSRAPMPGRARDRTAPARRAGRRRPSGRARRSRGAPRPDRPRDVHHRALGRSAAASPWPRPMGPALNSHTSRDASRRRAGR